MAGKELTKKNFQEGTMEKVQDRIDELQAEGGLDFPESYSPQNALKSAWLILQGVKTSKKSGEHPVLDYCTRESVVNTLMDMVIQGLSPAKKQCYFLPYGKTLTLHRSYFGTVAVTKRLKGVKNVVGNVIYKDDDFAYKFDLETGEKVITKHDQKLESVGTENIVGAYSIVITEGEEPNHVEIMTMDQIRQAWSQGMGEGKTHKDFRDQMAIKTVHNRSCKMYVNTSDDSDVLIGAINRTTENEYIEAPSEEEEVQNEIEEKANKKELSFTKRPVENEKPKQTAKKEKPKKEASKESQGYEGAVDVEYTDSEQQAFVVEDPGF